MDIFGNLFKGDKEKEQKSAVVLLVKMMTVDGTVDPQEKALLPAICKARQIPLRVVEEALRHPEKISFQPPESMDDRAALLIDLVWMMLANANVDPRELDLAKKAARKLGFDDSIVEHLIRKIVSDLQAARQKGEGRAAAKKKAVADIDAFLGT